MRTGISRIWFIMDSFSSVIGGRGGVGMRIRLLRAGSRSNRLTFALRLLVRLPLYSVIRPSAFPATGRREVPSVEVVPIDVTTVQGTSKVRWEPSRVPVRMELTRRRRAVRGAGRHGKNLLGEGEEFLPALGPWAGRYVKKLGRASRP